jgi:hypothetical protein
MEDMLEDKVKVQELGKVKLVVKEAVRLVQEQVLVQELLQLRVG